MTRLAWVGLALSVAISSPIPSTAQNAPVTRRDSAGVSIVENTAPLASLPVWRIDPVPLLSLGGGDPASGNAFTGVVGARQLADGSIVVVDTRASEVKLFDRTGKFLKVLGRKGGGPGEFQMPWVPTRLAGDSIYILDMSLRRAALYRGTELLGNLPIPQPSRTMQVQTIGLITAETFVGAGFGGGQPQQAGVRYRNPVPVLRISASAILDTLAVGRGFELVTAEFSENGRTMIGGDGVAMGSETKAVVAGRTLLVGDTGLPEFLTIALAAGTRRIVRWRTPPDPVTAADRRERFRFDSTAAMGFTGGSEGMRASRLRNLRSQIFSEQAQAFTDILGLDDGSVWLERFARPWTLARQYLAFDQTGVLVARVELPPQVRVYQVVGDRIVARWCDEDDVDHVRVYRIRKER